MSEMIERVAKAIYDDIWEEFEDQEHMKQKMLSASRAAIEAMREPTEDMIYAGNGESGHGRDIQVWQAMIDAALGDGK